MSAKKSSTPAVQRPRSSRSRKKASETGDSAAESHSSKASLSGDDTSPPKPKNISKSDETISMTDEKAVLPAENENTVEPAVKTRKRRATSKAAPKDTPRKATAPRRKRATSIIKVDPNAPADQPIEIPGFTDDFDEVEPVEIIPVKKPRVTKRKSTAKSATPAKRIKEKEPEGENPSELSSALSPLDEAASKEEKPIKKRRTSTKKPAKAKSELSEENIQSESAAQERIPDSASGADVPSSSKLSETSEEEAPRFDSLGLSRPILQAIEEIGYTTPTPIQYRAIPEVLAGHDVLGVAQTGTGKTASFTLPLLEKLSNSRARARMPRSLILEPTRELALQVADNFELYGRNLRLNHALLIGGNSMNEQRDLLNRGVDVLIATPGRLLDLFDRGGLLLMQTDLLVIDEADRMLDMGFIPDIERIVSLLPRSRQTLFFSATMAPEIKRLADAFLTNPKEITVARQSSIATTITERLCIVEKQDKKWALKKALQHRDVENAIIFCNRKRDVDELQTFLSRNRFSVGHLHGDLTQNLRFSTLEKFRSGELKILVCSDVAARGIDIDGLSHVFNYDLPINAEDYVHRIGRTGRAGKEGFALSFALPTEHLLLEAIERLTGKVIEYTAIDGIAPAEWYDDESSSGSSSRQNSARDKDRSRTKREKGPNPQNKPSQQESRNADKKTDRHQNRRGLLPPMPDSEDNQEGFGSTMPAFMNVRFRLSPHILSDSK